MLMSCIRIRVYSSFWGTRVCQLCLSLKTVWDRHFNPQDIAWSPTPIPACCLTSHTEESDAVVENIGVCAQILITFQVENISSDPSDSQILAVAVDRRLNWSRQAIGNTYLRSEKIEDFLLLQPVKIWCWFRTSKLNFLIQEANLVAIRHADIFLQWLMQQRLR